MKKKLILSLTLIFFSIFYSYLLNAEDNVYSLNQIVVTESRTPEKKKFVSSNVIVITEQEIKESTATNVGDLLAEKGIGHITKYPGTLTTVEIRGFRGDSHGNDLQSHILVLIDGHRAGTGNLAKILTDNIERIEIIRGPGAVQYGSAGMGGVINIITKKAKKNTFYLKGGYGTFDEKKVVVGGSVKKSIFDFSGSVTYYKRNDYETGDNEDYHNTYIGDTTNVSLNTGINFLKNHRLGLIFNGFKVSREGNPGYINKNDLDNHDDKRRYSFDLNYTGKVKNFDILARYFWGQDRNIWFDPVQSNASGWDNGIPYKNYVYQDGAQFQSGFNWNNLGIINKLFGSFGFDWIDYVVKKSYTPTKSEYNNYAIFLISNLSFLNEKLTFSLGGRYDWYKVDLKDSGGTEDKKHFTPKIGVSLLITKWLKIRAQYAEGFKMPDAQELAANFTSWWTKYVGNSGLDPEKSKTLEGGFDISYKGFNLSFTYFGTKFKDKIERYSPSPGIVSWRNLGDATIKGVEFSSSYDFGTLFNTIWEISPYINGVKLTDAWDKENDTKLMYEPDFTASFGLNIRKEDDFFGNINFSYHGREKIQDWSMGWPAPIRYKGGFTVCDVVLEKKVYEKNNIGKFSLRGEIRNLFDKEYSYIAGYPMPGRSFFVSLEYSFK